MNKIKNEKFAVCADGTVGVEIINFFLKEYPAYLKIVIVVDEESDVYKFLKLNEFSDNNIIFFKNAYSDQALEQVKKLELDFLILAWWPFIVKSSLYSLPKIGTINFHPSYLPFNRGKHYNFWSLVEETIFGVSIHFVNDSIDGGDIIFQQKIDKTWEDTGETLYYKAQKCIVDLFVDNFKLLLIGNYNRIKQNSNEGSFHYANELESASEIKLDSNYKGRELLNLLRARTFKGYPGCFFIDCNSKYEIRIEIKEIK